MSADNAIMVVEKGDLWYIFEACMSADEPDAIPLKKLSYQNVYSYAYKIDAMMKAAEMYEASSVCEHGIRIIPEEKFKTCPTCGNKTKIIV